MSINGIKFNGREIIKGAIQASFPIRQQYGSVFDEVFSNNSINNKKTDEADMKIIAHRGYTKAAPENTIPAFIMAAERGYSTIECDVEWTKDGVPVILHDETINRTARKANGTRLLWPRKCSNMTYKKLLEYDFGSRYSDDFKGTKIPKLTEVLDCAKNYDLNLYIELKETDKFDDKKAKTLMDEVKKAGLEDKITWISFNSDYLKRMSKLMPKARLGYLSKKSVDANTIETLKSLKTGENEVFLNLKFSKVSKDSSEMLKNAGFDFEIWTVDDSDELKKLSEYDFKGVTTNKITEEDIADYYNP